MPQELGCRAVRNGTNRRGELPRLSGRPDGRHGPADPESLASSKRKSDRVNHVADALRRPPDQPVGIEDKRLPLRQEGSGERGEDAGRFEVRAVAPSRPQAD